MAFFRRSARSPAGRPGWAAAAASPAWVDPDGSCDWPAIDRTGGAIVLNMRGMGGDADRLKERAELEPDSDAALVEAGWASITPLVGVRESTSDSATEALDAALATQPG